MTTKDAGIALASIRFSVTPQTISGQIALLEIHFGTTLFQKIGRNIELTEKDVSH
jgi:LysR family transcriptional activator of nhaA